MVIPVKTTLGILQILFTIQVGEFFLFVNIYILHPLLQLLMYFIIIFSDLLPRGPKGEKGERGLRVSFLLYLCTST